MKANRRFLGILIVIFVALAAALVLQNNQVDPNADEGTEPTPQLRRLFPELAVLDILALRVEDRFTGDTFTLARNADGTWLAQIDENSETAELEQNAGTILARSAVLMSHTQTITLSPDRSRSEFGFRPDAQLYVSILAVDNRQYVVAVGDPLQTGPYYYAIVNERPEIYVIDRAAIDTLAATLTTPPLVTPTP
jgi:hypothetical protein